VQNLHLQSRPRSRVSVTRLEDFFFLLKRSPKISIILATLRQHMYILGEKNPYLVLLFGRLFLQNVVSHWSVWLEHLNKIFHFPFYHENSICFSEFSTKKLMWKFSTFHFTTKIPFAFLNFRHKKLMWKCDRDKHRRVPKKELPQIHYLSTGPTCVYSFLVT
jgi:hypothetical protein